MAASWLKTLQCKSRAFDDVYNPTVAAPKHLLPSTSCRNSFRSLKDVLHNPTPTPKPSLSLHRRSESFKSKSVPINSDRNHLPFFPSVTDLTVGHPSRNVVEIIFQTRWGPKPFSGRIEMVFKIQNPPRDLDRFEEYRDSVKIRASSGDGGRCSADGNEMMRFRCLGDCVAGGADWGKAAAVCTYSGSGRAHESAGGGWGRRAMLVCRVIAGRVRKRVGLEDGSGGSEFESLRGEDGELVVFDSRAVLPCFLVIYKL